jgi:hypothetical protein
VNTKCREIQEAASLAGENYNQIKMAKAAKAQFERWQKKVSQMSRCEYGHKFRNQTNPLHFSSDQREQEVLDGRTGVQRQHCPGSQKTISL